MSGTRFFGAAALAAAVFVLPSGALAACNATIQAASDTAIAPGPTFNVGQQATFTVTGMTPVSYLWSVSGAVNIKDYSDDLGTITQTLPAAPLAWAEFPLLPSDMNGSSLSLYWKPSAFQTHPVNMPETRTVTLNYSDGTNSCQANLQVTIERNTTDVTRQPEDYFTSNHPSTLSGAQVGQGRVIDEHKFWHTDGVGGRGGAAAMDEWWRFLAWHGYFLRRYEEWRAAFGYPKVVPWYPGRRLPSGPEFDNPGLRQAFNHDFNRIPLDYTLAGTPVAFGSMPPVVNVPMLANFHNLDAFSGSLEGSYHGSVHCNIGSWTGFGSMCDFSSPKDPMFWRWHGFLDVLYRNYCALKGLLNCHSPAAAAADPWIGDNIADVNANGVPPSTGIRYASPEIWNRRSENLDPLCLPGTIPNALNTVGGVDRNCGSELDHENPESGKPNFLYATLRNVGGIPVENAYAEVAVYIADASTGLSWPADFQLLGESRQFITLNLKPNQVTAIGPLPWTAPSNATSDHWCIYIRILSVQEGPLGEGTVVDTNVANSNSIAWRNLKIVNPGQNKVSRFIVRNIRREAEALALTFDAAPALMRGGRIVLQLDPALQRALAQGPLPDGVKPLGKGRYALTGLRTRIEGLRLPPRGQGVAQITLEGAPAGATGDVVVSQASRAGVDGGVVLRVAGKRRR